MLREAGRIDCTRLIRRFGLHDNASLRAGLDGRGKGAGKNGYVSIPNKELMDKFADMIQKEPSLGYSEKPEYTGRILAVGIAYYKEDKKHSCKIEVLREKE